MFTFIPVAGQAVRPPRRRHPNLPNTTTSAPTRSLPTKTPFIAPTTLRRTLFTGVALTAALATTLHFRHRFRNVKMAASTPSSTPTTTLPDLPNLKDIDGNPIPPTALRNKVVFAINVASACGYTKSGYELLKHLTDKYPPTDFAAIAIPCNSFGWQENGSPDQIKTFALARAQRLIITERSVVNGDNPHPIVALAKQAFPGRIAWNFDGRFVFDRQGKPAARFGNSATTAEIEKAIDDLL